MKPQLETLSDRICPSSAYLDATGNLVVVGNDVRDQIVVHAENRHAITVTLDGVPAGTFDVGGPLARVIVLANGGNDGVIVYGSQLPVEEHGGGGNDSLYAIMSGYGPGAVLFGESGDDVLTSGAAPDVLVGGTGRDWLQSGGGDDVLVAGDVNYDGIISVGIGGDTSSPYGKMVAVSHDWTQNHNENSVVINTLVTSTTDTETDQPLYGQGQADLYIHSATDRLAYFDLTEGDRERLV